MNLAMAMMVDAPLPVVRLVQVGEHYYVQDGHHRISVARALGYIYIDAEVTVWEMEPQPGPVSLPSSPGESVGSAEVYVCQAESVYDAGLLFTIALFFSKSSLVAILLTF
jgi:hypothetical protein